MPSRDGISSKGAAGGGGDGGSDAFSAAEGMGAEREAKLYPFFQGVWQRISDATAYPDDFAKGRVQGKVKVQFEVDRRGMFTGRFVSAEGNDLLKAYVLATLAHALRDPLRKGLESDQDKIVILAEFDFSVYTRGGGRGSSALKAGQEHFKNLLSFERVSYVDPWLNEKFNEFLSRFVPPIIPVPGGFIIDFIRAYKLARQIGQPEPTDAEKRAERLRFTKEAWERTIR